MSMWWSANSLNLALCVATGLRAVQFKAVSMTRPPSLRRARDQALRLITVVAGH
jgi:hypothetical protein